MKFCILSIYCLLYFPFSYFFWFFVFQPQNMLTICLVMLSLQYAYSRYAYKEKKVYFFIINLHFVKWNQISTYRKLNLPLASSVYFVFLPTEMQKRLEIRKYHTLYHTLYDTLSRTGLSKSLSHADKFAYTKVLGISSAWNQRKARMKIVREVIEACIGCSWGKGNFVLIYELIFGQNWKSIWPSLFSFSM